MKAALFALSIAFGTSAHAEAPSAERLSVAVLDLKSSSGTEGIARALTTLVASEIETTPGFHAVSRNDLKAILAHQADATLLGCDEVRCFASIAKLANADRLVAGSVEKSEGDTAVFSLVLIDPAGPVVLERATATWRSNVDDMVDLARPLVDQLLHGKGAVGHVGSLEILAAAGAAIAVDGKELGEAPLRAAVRELPIGAHRVEVRKPGFLPYGQDVAIANGETHVLQVDLIDEESAKPWYEKWWVWTTIGGTVVVVGGAAAAIGTYAYLSQEPPTRLLVKTPVPGT
jgi:hypothetical protein